ncbi:MAG: hypothetical protein WCP29_04420 [Acidobacteriota bacterium]
MTRARFASLVVGTLVGAAAASLSLAVAYGLAPSIRLEMDRDTPATTRGFFPVERGDGKTFAWTEKSAELTWPDLDRNVPWTCKVSLLGWRPAAAPLPTVRVSADGLERVVWASKGGNEDLRIDIPVRRDASGLVLALAVSDTFRPADDPRDLGVAVDRIVCEPAAGARAAAPMPALWQAMGAGAVLGLALGLIGLAWPVAAMGALLLSMAQAATLVVGAAPYLPGHPPAILLAASFAVAMVALVLALDAFRREPLSTPTRIAIGLSAVLCYLKLLVVLHPDMPPGDAVFQAHRLEWVLAGRYYFTSLTPDGYLFPYGISLYLIAAPFASLVRDHVALLRGVVCVAEALAGLSLYAVVSRTWQGRGTGVVAVLLFHVTPIASAVVGTGNLTNAFGESAALLAIATIVSLPIGWPVWAWLLAPMLIASIAFIAHFSTFMVLAVTMCAVGLLYYTVGGPMLRRAASCVLIGLGLAIVVSTLLFYGHFWNTYRSQAQRLASAAGTLVSSGARPADPRPQVAPTASPVAPRVSNRRGRPSLGDRLSTLGRRTTAAYGWLLPFSAMVGVVLLVRRRVRDRLSLAIAAWLATLVVCAGLAVLTPLELRYQLAVAPALALLGGVAGSGAWRTGGWRRWATAALLAAIVVAGARNWLDLIL